MIYTNKFNSESPTLLPNKRTDGIETTIYKFEDGTYCRQIGDTGVYLQTDCNGDVWFDIEKSLLDVIPATEAIDLLVSIADSLNVEVYDKTFRELHKFINENETKAEIKSGFYTVDLTIRAFKTCDLEFGYYCSYFFISDNTYISQAIMSDVI